MQPPVVSRTCWSTSKNTKSVIKCPRKEPKPVENQIDKNIIHDNSAAISVGLVDGDDVESSSGEGFMIIKSNHLYEDFLYKYNFDFLYNLLYYTHKHTYILSYVTLSVTF